MIETHDYVTIGELAELNTESLGTKTPGDYTFKYIDLSSVSHGSIDHSRLETFRFVDAPSRARRIVRDGDILFGTVRPQLRSHARVVGDGFIASTGFSIVRPRPDVADGEFLSHYLLSDEATRQTVRREVGSNYPAVTEKDVASLKLRRIPFDEQKQIAEILDAIDATIQSIERVIAKHQKIRDGLASDLLWISRSDKNPVAIGTLGDLAELRMGQSPRGSVVSELRDGLPFLQGNAEFGIQSPKPRYQCHEAPRRAAPGDTLISVRAPVGAMNVADQAYGIGRGLAAIRFTGLNERFGHLALQQSAHGLGRVCQGTTFTAVGRTELASLPLPAPPLEEQRRIVEILDTSNTTIQSHTDQLAKLRQVRLGLATDLLSGRVKTRTAQRCSER